MTYIKRVLTLLYAFITLRFVFSAFSKLRRDPVYLSFPLVGRIVAKVSVVLALLTWPVTFPLVRWRARRANRSVAAFIDQQAAQDEAWDISWPSEWDDGLTPEQERYWEGYFGEDDPSEGDYAWIDAMTDFLATDCGEDCGEDGCLVHERLREENRPLTIEEALVLANTLFGADPSGDEPVVVLMTWTEDPSEAEVYAQANEDEKSPLYQGVTILGRP